MSSDKPLVSIVLVCRDGKPYLDEALTSVLRQTETDWELLFFDNGSTDGSREIALSLAPPGNPGARWRIQPWSPSLPVGEARNRCVALARADLVAFLDADDSWRPEKLVLQLGLLARSGAGLVFSDALVVDGQGRALGRFSRRWPPSRGGVHEALLGGNFIPHSTVLVRKEVLQSLGGFDRDLRIACDYDFWLRASRTVAVDYLGSPLATWRVHGRNLTDDFRLAYEENERIYRSLLGQAPGHHRSEYRARVHQALAILCWKWGVRSLGSGEGLGPAFQRIRDGFRWCEGGVGGAISALRFLRGQLRGLSLRIRMERASADLPPRGPRHLPGPPFRR